MGAAIEDVQYLKEHGHKESYLFLVDSSQRDKLVWRTPAEYAITFDSPFRHVYGLDVIEAYVPRTQYVIDAHNNTLVVGVAGEVHALRIEPGDYNVNQLVVELNKLLPGITVETVTKPPELKNLLRFFSSAEFAFNMSASTVRDALGFSQPLDPLETERFQAPQGYTAGVDPEVFRSRVVPGAFVTQNTLFAPTPDLENILLVGAGTWVRQRFVAQAGGSVFRVAVNCGVVGSAPADSQIYFEVVDASGTVYAYGNIPVVINQFLQASVATKDEIVQALPLVRGGEYYVIIKDPDNGSAASGYGVLHNSPAIPLPEAISTGDASVWSSGQWTTLEPAHHDLCVSLDVFNPTHIIQPPGLCNLTGERFIQLRCREIEQHLYRTRAYEKYNVGLAKMQMGVFGYGQDRFDYSSIPPREFHPIGRLSTLTLRFERPDGTLYDFKGVDHNLMLVIRYYAVAEESFNQQILNPSYDPNLLTWMQKDMDRYDSEED